MIEELEKLEISGNKKIEILDCGTSGSDLLFHLKECPRIIIIDALDAGQEEGGIACIKEKDIESFLEKKISSLSLHDLDLSDIFKMARVMKLKSDITIIGIKPLNTGFGDMLSPEISRKIPEVISMILEIDLNSFPAASSKSLEAVHYSAYPLFFSYLSWYSEILNLVFLEVTSPIITLSFPYLFFFMASRTISASSLATNTTILPSLAI